jgi:NAD-dependent dihydropyrimidine dehydrogenase PreA subunit
MEPYQWAKPVNRLKALSTGYVETITERCIQCGICSYHCPAGIDVRRHAWLGTPVHDSHCITCGECVERCPRGALRMAGVTFQAGRDAGSQKERPV